MTRRLHSKAGMIPALACLAWTWLALAAGPFVPPAGAATDTAIDTAIDTANDTATDAATAPRWIVLPFADYTDAQTGRRLAPQLEAELAARNIEIVGNAEIRPILRSLRIRSSEGIGQDELRRLAAEIEFDFLVLGSWDILRDGGNPEFGLSMRVLDRDGGRIVRAVSTGATGDDFTGLLGRGRLLQLDDLVRHTLPVFVSELLADTNESPRARAVSGCRRVAIIPLDDAVERVPAGPIVQNSILARLVQAGYEVVEPGFVRELMLESEIAARGGVDLPTSRLLSERLGVCRVITGEVDRFEWATGDPATTVPSVAFGLRTVLPVEGLIDRVWELERTGSESDRFLQRGRIHAVHPLIRAALKEWTNELNSNAR